MKAYGKDSTGMAAPGGRVAGRGEPGERVRRGGVTEPGVITERAPYADARITPMPGSDANTGRRSPR